VEIKVLGTGCKKCQLLFAEAQQAIVQSGRSASLEKVEEIEEIAAHGVVTTPALVIDGRVVSAGRVPSRAEIAAAIARAAADEAGLPPARTLRNEPA
jgi:small redox-active disulfide protein 2